MKKGLVESKQNDEFKILGLDFPEIILIIANIVPLIGMFFLNWSLFSVLILYWTESAVIGFFTILKILIAKGFPKNPQSNLYNKNQKKIINIIFKVILIPFFIFHYGMFMFGHLLGIIAISSIAKTQINVFQIIISIFYSVIFLFISHGISFFTNFIKKKEYERVSPTDMMNAPYKRIVLMHLIIIFGAFIITLTNLPEMVGALLIIGKTIIDFKAHRKEHDSLIK